MQGLRQRGGWGQSHPNIPVGGPRSFVGCDRLLDAVKEQVRTDPTKFETFVGIFRKEPASSCYTDILINS